MATSRLDARASARPPVSGSPPSDLEPSRDPMVAGAPGAVALLAAFRADPRAPFGAWVTGPGGSGKTALVAALLRAARQRGVTARRLRPGDAVPPDGDDTLLIVDDAHRLDHEDLARLAEAADDPDVRMVVTARPAPRPPGLAALGMALARTRTPLTLAPLGVGGVGERIAAVLGHRCPLPLAELVVRLTGGSPVLVDRLAATVRDEGPSAMVACAERGSPEVPAAAFEQLRTEIEVLEEPVRRLLLALTVADPETEAPSPTRIPAATLAELLDVDRGELDALVVAARASGLLHPHGDAGLLPPLVHRAVVRCSGGAERLALGRDAATQALARGGPVLAVARALSGVGLRGDDLAAVFGAAGDEALATRPGLAGRLYSDAVTAGAPARELVVRRAEAAALDADLDTALRLADPVTADLEAPGRERALAVVATAMAQRGMVAEGARMLAEPGTGLPGLPGLAVPGLVATGSLERARALLDPASGPAPDPGGTSSTLRSATDLIALGVLDSVTPTPGTALSRLTRAASLLEPVGGAVLLPDSPSALAALVAVHLGELDVADSVLRRALAAGLGGRATAARHHLLRAWIAMIRGDLVGARELAADAGPPGAGATEIPVGLEPRDEIVAAALEVGLARRAGDATALRTAWVRAREALVRHPVDLFVLGPLGEIAVGAARLRETAAARAVAEQIEDLLGRLGNPPLWQATTSWHGLAAASTAEDLPAARHHVEVLAGLGAAGGFAAALSAAAGARLAALGGRVDAAEVEAAATGLQRYGWTWDAARLAGEAAIRTPDRRAMATLLACARSLSDTGRPAASDPGGAPSAGPVPDTDEVTLSEREREVAILVLAGLTYKQIGARLYISSKTVEHHVARMRQRLASTNRGELFARLRDLVGDPG